MRVRYAETDQMGIVYYANYLIFFEVARADWLRSGGWSYREMEKEGLSLPVVEAHCTYRQPARYDDDLEVTANGELLSPVRVQFNYEITRQGDRTILASGHTVHAALDAAGRPRRLPDRVRELFAPGAPPVSRAR